MEPYMGPTPTSYRLQATGYRIQTRAYKHAGIEDAKMQGCKDARMQDAGIKDTPRSLVAPEGAGGYIYIYMKPERGPQTMFFRQLLWWNPRACQL